jgi:ABC-type transporter Mla subunit MlaD
MTKKLGDPVIALTVVICSAVLFAALAFALQGNPFDRPSRTLKAQFVDITGIQQSSLVKYAGAKAGYVHGIRMLTPQERAASAHPENTVEVTLAINNNVPALNEGLTASVASDTLLSDKFVLLSGGNPTAPVLASGAAIGSITPVTFDAILRDLAGALAKMRVVFGDLQGGTSSGILAKVDKLMTDLNDTVAQAQGLIGNANGLVKNGDSLIANADGMVNDGRALIDTNKEPIKNLIAKLTTAANTLDQLATRTDKLVKDNAGAITSTTRDAHDAVKELKAAASSTRALVDMLRARPQSLIWGPGRQPKQP